MSDRISPAELEILLATNSVLLFDVRRRVDRDASPRGIQGGEWHSPDEVDTWSAGLPPGRSVVVYCVRGGSVSASVHAALISKGINARVLEGGLAAWEEYRAGA